MKKKLFFGIVLAAVSLAAKDLTLVSNGTPAAEIVIPQNAPHLLKFAAKELQSHIKKISKAKLPIIDGKNLGQNNLAKIFIGMPPDSKGKERLESSGPDTYRIVTSKGNIYLFGRDYYGPPMTTPSHPFRLAQTWNPELKLSKFGETGSLYAVYDLLRQLGVRWFMPGKIGTVIPHTKNLTVKPQDRIVSPDFSYRHIYYNDFDNDPEGAIWYRRIGLGAKRPLYFMHTFNILLKKLKKEHPECLALINGKRDFNTTCMGQGSMCLSNPATLNEAIKFVQEQLKTTKSYNIFPLVPQDGYKRSCGCKKCVGKPDFDAPDDGILSNYVWSFINNVAKKIAETNPEKRLGALAYSCYRIPPDKVKNISPNLDVMYCYDRSLHYLPEKSKHDWKNISEWVKRCRNLYSWNYYLFWHENSPLTGAPIIFTGIIADDFANIKGKIKGEFIEASKLTVSVDKKAAPKRRKLACPGMQHLNIYVTASLYWNNNLELNKLLDDYCNKFYGPAAPEMHTFFQEAEKMWLRPYYRGYYGKNALVSKIFPLKDLEKLKGILEQAAGKAKQSKNKNYFDRVNLIYRELLFFVNTRYRIASSKHAAYDCRMLNSETYPTSAQWEKASAINLYQALDGRKPKIRTQIKILRDKKFIYLLFDCFEKDMKSVKASCRKHDGYIWRDDTVQLFLMSPGAKKYFQIVINPHGAIWDGEWEIGKDKGHQQPVKWESKTQCSIKRYPDRWQVRMALPANLFVKGDKIDIKANFMRTKHINGQKKLFSWIPVFNSNIHDTTIFGTIK